MSPWLGMAALSEGRLRAHLALRHEYSWSTGLFRSQHYMAARREIEAIREYRRRAAEPYDGRTLTGALAEAGYTHRAASRYGQRDILDAADDVVFTGDAQATWEWLAWELAGRDDWARIEAMSQAEVRAELHAGGITDEDITRMTERVRALVEEHRQ